MRRDAPLPENYPMADAPWDEKLSWLDAVPPPYQRIRNAAPWLTTDRQVEWYLDGLREAVADRETCQRLARFIGPPHLAIEEGL